jgi:hypothetical protein
MKKDLHIVPVWIGAWDWMVRFNILEVNIILDK